MHARLKKLDIPQIPTGYNQGHGQSSPLVPGRWPRHTGYNQARIEGHRDWNAAPPFAWATIGVPLRASDEAIHWKARTRGA